MLVDMGVMLQIKDLPEDVHRELKARAAVEGVTLTEYAREQLSQIARRPSRRQLIADLQAIEPVANVESGAESVAAIRAEYDAA